MGKLRKLAKWAAYGVGGFVGLVVVAALVVPLVVDVDKFRPQILQAVNSQINGKAQLGKLRLSLWFRILVKAEGFRLVDAQGQEVVSVERVYFHLPLGSLLTGSPRVTFTLNEPKISVVSTADGLNVLTLMKPAEPTAEAKPPKAASGSGLESLPAVAINARLGLALEDAQVSYTDAKSELVSRIEKLNVRVRDLSLSHPTDVELTAELDTRMGGVVEVKGPLRFTAQADPAFQAGQFEKARVVLRADLDKVAIRYGELFFKKSGVPLHLKGTLTATRERASVEKLVAVFHNAQLQLDGMAEGWDRPQGLSIKVSARSNSIELGPWSTLVPILRGFELGGAASLNARAQGPVSALQYGAQVKVRDLTAKAPMLKAQPVFQAAIEVATDQVRSASLSMKAPGNDLRVHGSVVSFSKPRVQVSVLSDGMDLDQLVKFPQAQVSKAKDAPSASVKAAPAQESDFDALLAPLRGVPVFAAIVANLRVQIKHLIARKARFAPVEGTASLSNLVATLETFRIGAFGGSIQSSGRFELGAPTPKYRFDLGVQGLDLKQAVASQFEMFKNTLFGIANFQMEGTGQSFNPEPAKKSLKARGKFSVARANFATIDVTLLVGEALSSALKGLNDKVPQLSGADLKKVPNLQSGYETISAGFTIGNGVFSMPDFKAVSGKNRGIDIEGATRVGLLDYKLDAAWNLVDTHNLTGARDLSAQVAGVAIHPVLVRVGQPFRLPVVLTGTVFAPEPSYTAVPEAVAKVALENLSRAAGKKVKAEASKAVKKELKKLEKKAAPEVKKALKGLGKSLGF